MGQFFYYTLVVIQFFISVSLIVVVNMQESKNEGLTGQIGTTAASSFKGKSGREEFLNKITGYLGVAFFVICLLAAYGLKHWK